LRIDDQANQSLGRVAWPELLYLELVLPDAEPVAHITLSSLRKAPKIMPESMWLTFAPSAPETNGWTLDKVDQQVPPIDAVRGGARSMHAVTNYVQYRYGRGSFRLSTLDAQLSRWEADLRSTSLRNSRIFSTVSTSTCSTTRGEQTIRNGPAATGLIASPSPQANLGRQFAP
jgi:hypothetical protein